MNREKLKIKKQQLEKELKKIEQERNLKEKEMENSQEYKNLDKQYKELKKELDKLKEQTHDIEKEIKLVYLDKDSYPIYHSNYEYNRGRNIRTETITGIKRTLGIKNLSLLKGKEIEDIVKKLINNDLNKNKKYKEKKNRIYVVEDKIDEIRIGKDKLNDFQDKYWDKENKIYQEIREIEKEEELSKNPKDDKQREKQKRWIKENEARKKLSLVHHNLDKIHSAIIKERIMENIQD